MKIKNKTLCLLFLIALLIHMAAVLFIYYADFQPFSGGRGDYTTYNLTAQEVSTRVGQGNFSLEGLSFSHYYPIIVGYIYALTVPNMLAGQLFNALLAALSVIFVYLIVIEIGGSKKQGFFVGMVVSVYPSFLFYTSLLVKDALVVLLCLIGLLLILKLIQGFSWKRFLIFYIILGSLIHFRFYVGYALLLCFIISWIFFSNLKVKKRLACAVIIIFVLGFLPQIAAGKGYYGTKFLKQYLNPETITYFREVVYLPPEAKSQPSEEVSTPEEVLTPGQQSTIVVEAGFENPFTFLRNSLISFTYSLFGPFPWQMKHLKHLFVLPEMIAWYFLFFFAIKGIVKSIRRYRVILPLVIFSLILLSVLALFINNFGIITRIRIPAFISLVCLAPFGFKRFLKDNNIK